MIKYRCHRTIFCGISTNIYVYDTFIFSQRSPALSKKPCRGKIDDISPLNLLPNPLCSFVELCEGRYSL